jgi:hypothetical protein
MLLLQTNTFFNDPKMLFLFHFQATPKDKKASLVIHGLVDKVVVVTLSLRT